MKLLHTLDELPAEKGPISLTLGNFDGVHRGHKEIIAKLQEKGSAYLITFRNHPHKTLVGSSPPLLTNIEHKLFLLKQEGIKRCYLLDFTKEFASQSPKEFLSLLKEKLNFSSLILGHDAKIGYQQSGDKKCLAALSKELGFTLEYLSPYMKGGEVVSSSLLRTKIECDALDEVKELLGREYSLYAPITRGMQKGRALGFPTLNLEIEGLALPSFGVWVVTVRHQNKESRAIANLGYAPTLHRNRRPLLEVHLLEETKELYGDYVEVVFQRYLRPERCFASSAALKDQISKDIKNAKRYTHSDNARYTCKNYS